MKVMVASLLPCSLHPLWNAAAMLRGCSSSPAGRSRWQGTEAEPREWPVLVTPRASHRLQTTVTGWLKLSEKFQDITTPWSHPNPWPTRSAWDNVYCWFKLLKFEGDPLSSNLSLVSIYEYKYLVSPHQNLKPLMINWYTFFQENI